MRLPPERTSVTSELADPAQATAVSVATNFAQARQHQQDCAADSAHGVDVHAVAHLMPLRGVRSKFGFVSDCPRENWHCVCPHAAWHSSVIRNPIAVNKSTEDNHLSRL